MPISRRTLLGAALTAAPLGLAACSGASSPKTSTPTGSGSFRTLEQIRSSGRIRIGVFSDKAPFGYVDADGGYAGYDVVYAERIAEDLALEVEYVPVEAASRVEFLETAKVDLILANFTVTEERKAKVDFANPYMKVSLGVVSPDAAPITTADELAGRKVIVVKGTTAETFLEKNHPEVELTKYEQYTEATSALTDGRGDAWVTDNTEALAWALGAEGFSAGITSLGDPDTIAGAVPKGNTTLLEWLNQHLVELGKEQFFHADFEQTLRPVYGDAVPADELVVEGGQV
ncbi:amino acid ABC transporter substrate-binding protein [Arachnia propionica]|uniref:Amino acid ABC transporter substrate-binding protein n=1 Tax=Arachnia propionica TaxID=1750 RepID=A0A3P1T9B7_9ACTN|nr:transporter substrate-binding domain-containing protein [Arachnia propionica]RRD06044.1 amino acid ABC transporter substrate-binding protein [Arachnia propionica]